MFSGLKQLPFYSFKILCINNFGCTELGGLLLVSIGITHVIAVLATFLGLDGCRLPHVHVCQLVLIIGLSYVSLAV